MGDGGGDGGGRASSASALVTRGEMEVALAGKVDVRTFLAARQTDAAAGGAGAGAGRQLHGTLAHVFL